MTRAQCSIEVDPGKSFSNCNIRGITLSKNHTILICLLANMPQWNWSTKRFRAEKKIFEKPQISFGRAVLGFRDFIVFADRI